MRINKHKLIAMGASETMYLHFTRQTRNLDVQVDASLLVGGECNYFDLLWLASQYCTEDELIAFACDCVRAAGIDEQHAILSEGPEAARVKWSTAYHNTGVNWATYAAWVAYSAAKVDSLAVDGLLAELLRRH